MAYKVPACLGPCSGVGSFTSLQTLPNPMVTGMEASWDALVTLPTSSRPPSTLVSLYSTPTHSSPYDLKAY